MRLVFELQRVPRSTTREQWMKLWQWKRVTEKQLSAENRKRMENLALYGTTHPELYESFVNPPVLLAPGHDWSF